MTAENLYQWSSTASNNGSVDSGINASEGQLPSTVNNGIRGAMAAVARWLGDNNATRTLSGSANTYVASALYTGSTYSTGLQLTLKANAGNTGGATLAVTNALGSALGSKQIRKFTPSGETSLAASNIIANGLYSLIYDAAASGGSGAFILQNPTRVLSDLASTTGTGSVVLASGPTLIAPILGAASATTYNNIAHPAPSSTAILAMANSVQLSVVSSTIIGRGQYLGTNTSDSASTGNIGEVLSNTAPIASAVVLATGTAKTVASVTLTPGNWLVYGMVGYTGSGTTSVTILRAMISPTDNAANQANGFINNQIPNGAAVFAQDNPYMPVGPTKVSVNTNTPYYMVAQAFFSNGSTFGFGNIEAVRPR